ncbi:hypothetical protein Hanom_Chr08g00719631 [Helianthus anomalus]
MVNAIVWAVQSIFTDIFFHSSELTSKHTSAQKQLEIFRAQAEFIKASFKPTPNKLRAITYAFTNNTNFAKSYPVWISNREHSFYQNYGLIKHI